MDNMLKKVINLAKAAGYTGNESADSLHELISWMQMKLMFQTITQTFDHQEAHFIVTISIKWNSSRSYVNTDPSIATIEALYYVFNAYK